MASRPAFFGGRVEERAMWFYVLGFVCAFLCFFYFFGRHAWFFCVACSVGSFVVSEVRADAFGGTPVAYFEGSTPGTNNVAGIGKFFTVETPFAVSQCWSSVNTAVAGFPIAMCEMHDYGTYWYGQGTLFQTWGNVGEGSTPNSGMKLWSVKWVKGSDSVTVMTYTEDLAVLKFGGMGEVMVRVSLPTSGQPNGGYAWGRRFCLDQNNHFSDYVERDRQAGDTNGLWLIGVDAGGAVSNSTTRPASTRPTDGEDGDTGGDDDGGDGPTASDKHWLTAVKEGMLGKDGANGDTGQTGVFQRAFQEHNYNPTGDGGQALSRFTQLMPTLSVGTDETVAADFNTFVTWLGAVPPDISGDHADLKGEMFGAVGDSNGYMKLWQQVVDAWVGVRQQMPNLVLNVRRLTTGLLVWTWMVFVYRMVSWAFSAGTGGAINALEVEGE